MLHSWKFAADAVWEKALSIDATQPIDVERIKRWVAKNPQNIAFEAIFDENGTPATMFGIRITSLSKAEQRDRIATIISQTPAIKSESDFRKIAADIFPEFALFKEKLEALNIGIVSQWYSFGPGIVWNRQSKEALSAHDLKTKAPRFFEPTQNPAAIEFWYTKPIDHWYKIYVSDPQDDGYILSPEKYQAAIRRLPDFTPCAG